MTIKTKSSEKSFILFPVLVFGACYQVNTCYQVNPETKSALKLCVAPLAAWFEYVRDDLKGQGHGEFGVINTSHKLYSTSSWHNYAIALVLKFLHVFSLLHG